MRGHGKHNLNEVFEKQKNLAVQITPELFKVNYD